MFVVGVFYKDGLRDPVGEGTKAGIADLRINVDSVKSMQTYFLEGNLTEDEVKKIGGELLVDVIVQDYRYGRNAADLIGSDKEKSFWFVSVKPKKGVMDPAGLTVQDAAKIIGIKKDVKVTSGYAYKIFGTLKREQIESICQKCLANGLIEDYEFQEIK